MIVVTEVTAATEVIVLTGESAPNAVLAHKVKVAKASSAIRTRIKTVKVANGKMAAATRVVAAVADVMVATKVHKVTTVLTDHLSRMSQSAPNP